MIPGPISPQQEVTTSSSPETPTNPGQNSATTWSEEEVQEWMKKEKLHCSTLEAFKGAALYVLYEDLQADRKAFKQDLKTDFEMDFATSARFIAALQQLFAE